MILTVKLRGSTIDETTAHCRRALEEFACLGPSYLALDRWLRTSYRQALVGSALFGPRSIQPPTPVAIALTSAQCQLANVRRLAREAGDLAREIPPRVYITRVEDDSGKYAFAPVDAHGDVSLTTRALSLFFADYLSSLHG